MSDPSSTPEGAFSPEDRKVIGERVPFPPEAAPAVASVEKARPASFAQRQGITVLIAAIVAGVVAVVVATAISVGVNFWMAGSGGRSDRLVQEGKVKLGPDGVKRDVFYAVPFEGPPNLEIESSNMNFITLKEQKADHFSIQAAVPIEVRWRAEGVRAAR